MKIVQRNEWNGKIIMQEDKITRYRGKRKRLEDDKYKINHFSPRG
jgi:hypothetical protein